MHIAFLDANTDRSDFATRHASEVDKFRTLMGPVAPAWQFSAFKVSDGQFPDDLAAFDGVMISGSVASVNDPDPWVARLMQTIRSAVADDLPVFGACFGHQAIAKALGGTVGANPQGWMLGRVETPLTSPAPWMTAPPPRTALHAAHKEQVTALPPGARILGGTPQVPNGHLALGSRVFSTQYHPEITRDFMAALITYLDGHVPDDTRARAEAALNAPLDDTRMAEWIARFFAQARG